MFRELGDENRLGAVTYNLAWSYWDVGKRDRARELIEENLDRARRMGNDRMLAFGLGSLAEIATEEERFDDALSLLKEELRIRWKFGDRLLLADLLSRFGLTHARMSRMRTAAQLLSRSLSALDEVGGSVTFSVAKVNEETLAALHAQLDETAFAEAWEEGQKLTMDEAVALALDS